MVGLLSWAWPVPLEHEFAFGLDLIISGLDQLRDGEPRPNTAQSSRSKRLMTDHKPIDVLIIGTRPTGTTLAIDLARRGRSASNDAGGEEARDVGE